jgi:hypothetical protein
MSAIRVELLNADLAKGVADAWGAPIPACLANDRL